MTRNAILDISRLYSRRHYTFDTGVDRVERAYFDALSATPRAVFLLRFGKFIVFLDEPAAREALGAQGKARPSRFEQLRSYMRFRRASCASQSLRDYAGYQFLNIGHSRHPKWLYARLKQHDILVKTFIHDVIPFDYPEMMRPGSLDRFREKFNDWVQYSDAIFTPSAYSAGRIRAHAPQTTPIVNPLHASPLANVQKGRTPENAWIILSTIEPRKNHMFLLKIWQDLVAEHGAQSPQLWIIGKRGWNNETVFNFLDSSPLMGEFIHEIGAISDDELRNYIARAHGLLFPSLSEGFGLPLYEAILSNKPVLASKLPVFEEQLGANCKSLLSLDEPDLWKRHIANSFNHVETIALPSWEQHIRVTIEQDDAHLGTNKI